VERKWQFKTKFRAKAFGWRGSRLAISRLKEAVSEIKAAAKSDPVAAGDGAVWLMERIWPAFQDIDTSSGALGTAVARTLDELIPILIDAPADHSTRSKWLKRLFEAVQDDGVQYLSPVENRFGEIARYPGLTNTYADELLPLLRQVWSDQKYFEYVSGTAICLSCLLEAGRYAELAELLAKQRMKFWSWQRFGAEALVRQGRWEEAVAFADSVRDARNPGYHKISIDLFCEKVLIQQGRSDEAYRRFGLGAATGTTNLAIYRSLVRTYPDRDRRQLLLDLIKTRGDKGKWFAAAKDAGFLDIALECCTTRTLQCWFERHGISVARSPGLPRPLRCSGSRICLRAAATIRRCRTSTRPSNISLRRQDRLVPSVGPNRNLAGWLLLHAFPAARYSSKPPRPHCRDTTPIRPLPSRNPHKISSPE